jgi:hypothetical protein
MAVIDENPAGRKFSTIMRKTAMTGMKILPARHCTFLNYSLSFISLVTCEKTINLFFVGLYAVYAPCKSSRRELKCILCAEGLI